MKTLANCTLSEFMGQAYKAREAFHALYAAAGVDRLRDDFLKQAQGADGEEARKKVSKAYTERLFWALLSKAPEKTAAVIAACGFMSVEEAEKLQPTEALSILMACAESKDVLDFFINAERLAGNSTGGILLMLTLLRLSVSDADTSPMQSQNSTKPDAEKSSAGDTSEKP